MAKVRNDAWANSTSGMGTAARDKMAGTVFLADCTRSEKELAELFRFNDFAKVIVSELTTDALRREPCAEPASEESEENDQEKREKQKREMKKLLRKHDAWVKQCQARIWGRLYGLGAVVMVPERATPEVLALPAREGAPISHMFVLSGPEMRPGDYYSDPLSEKFGTMAAWNVTRSALGGAATTKQIKIHESHMLVYGGVETPPNERATNLGREDSVLVAAYEALKAAGANWSSVSAMIQDLSVATYKLADYIDSLAGEGEAVVQARLAAMDLQRSVYRMIPLDKDGEDFEFKERGAATGLGDLIDKGHLRVASSARMPVTRLLGQSPAGLNATGESDRDIWSDQVQYEQEHKLAPNAQRLCNRLDPSAEWEIKFPALVQESDLQKEERLNKRAQTDKTYYDIGAALPEEIAIARFSEGSELGIEVDLELRQEMLENAQENALNPPSLAPIEGDPAQGEQPPAEGGSGSSGAEGPKARAAKIPPADA